MIINNKKVTDITIKHRGMGTCFRKIINEPFGDIRLRESEPIELEFEDTLELEAFIEILKDCKNWYASSLGGWRRQGGTRE